MTWRNVRLHGETTLRHGYTLTDLNDLTLRAVTRDRWHRAMDVTDRMETAWHAIVEHLYTTDDPPQPYDLINAANRAVSDLVRDGLRTHGYPTNDVWAGREAMVNYQRYWWTACQHAPSPEPRAVDRLAVQQILPSLSPRQREALTTLAAFGDYQQAATAMGIAFGTYRVLVSTARRRFLAAWHEGETPSRQWRTDRRVSFRNGRDYLGRRRLTTSQVDDARRRYQAGETLCAIAAEHGVSAVCLSRLIRGLSKPVPDQEAA